MLGGPETAEELRPREKNRTIWTRFPGAGRERPMPEGPEDERFVYVVTAAGWRRCGRGAVVVDSEREAPLSRA